MRVYTSDMLKGLSRKDLLLKLDMVKTSEELSQKEIMQNVDEIEFFLNGGVHSPIKKVIDDIKDCQADISDMGGN